MKQKPAPLRIRDAATLILYRKSRDTLEVLMGERGSGHAFLPNRYVFPGGKLDINDYRIRPAAPLNPVSHSRLSRARVTGPRKAVALALAAIRETFEETGLRIAAPAPAKAGPAPRGWRGFCAPDNQQPCLAPDPSGLVYICRAVTPPNRPRRFDARFFAAPAELAQGELIASEELGKLHWVTPEAAARLELPNITVLVLKHLAEWLDCAADPALPVPFFHNRGGKHINTPE
ncbi:NUDIX hydrolase [Ferrovibrio sp.]|uniref:NUDIX hydrolase n=1 Tax=Ferrovibrio sp. TaxID=1917215 RepID=UPI0025C6DF5B|nr:NUDIX hydrolase [Ferrovibrio sp.]MBX3455925.1 NUDIX hydrolase [Ferrovibrio sp.]